MLAIISRNAPELYKNGTGFVLEAIFTFGVLAVCEGSICRNYIRYYLAAALAQISVTLILLFFHWTNLLEIAIQIDYSSFKTSDIMLYNLLCVFFLLLFKPFVCKLTPDKPGRRMVYRILTVTILGESVIEVIMRSRPKELEERIMFRSLFVILVSASMILVVAVAYRKSRQLESRQIEKRQKLLSDAYQNLWEENRVLHFTKHELTRHMRKLRNLEKDMLEQEWMVYVSQLKEEMGNIFTIPCTGNVYVDAFILEQYKKAESMEILLELVLEPLPETFTNEKYLMTVLTEMFEYVLKKKQKAEYIRLSVRTRCNRYLVVMETGIQEKEYYRQKLIDQIGDKMFLRQAFRQTRYITINEDGGMLYRLETKRMQIMVML